jgi:16S rRNA (cytosine1402-N4)-methyltransferase
MHQTVLLQEAVDALAVKEAGVYVDGTFGRGGHSKAILKSLDVNACLYVFDKDPEAVAAAKKISESDSRVHVIHASFADLKKVFEGEGLLEKVDGILLDLGLSSPQLDEGERGFSFMRNGPLDMRMNNKAGQSAAEWISEVEEEELASVIKLYGEERFGKRIASAIVKAREIQPIEDTKTLAELVSQAIPKWEKKISTRRREHFRRYVYLLIVSWTI